ncbi:MAG: hypothetical protein QXI60_05440, partial [Thermofilaceae archaeon]
MLRLKEWSTTDKSRNKTDDDGKLGQAGNVHNLLLLRSSPAPSTLWAGVSGFGVYHPLYTTNGEKSQEDSAEIACGSRFGFL